MLLFNVLLHLHTLTAVDQKVILGLLMSLPMAVFAMPSIRKILKNGTLKTKLDQMPLSVRKLKHDNNVT